MQAMVHSVPMAKMWDTQRPQNPAPARSRAPCPAVETSGDEPWRTFCQRLTRPALLLASTDGDASE